MKLGFWKLAQNMLLYIPAIIWAAHVKRKDNGIPQIKQPKRIQVCLHIFFASWIDILKYCRVLVHSANLISLRLLLKTSNCEVEQTDLQLPKIHMSSTSTLSLPLQRNALEKGFPSSPATRAPFKTGLSFSFSLPLGKPIHVKSSSTAKFHDVVVDEEIDKIRRLQNGSDVRGVAVEGENGRIVDLTPPAVEAIAESFGEWVISRLEGKGGVPVEGARVSLGRDPRISGASLSAAVFSGLARAGCLAFDMGLATTPACFMSTLLPPFAYEASIMV